MDRIRVVHIISDTNIGGAGVLLCNLLRHTDRTRYDPFVILPMGSALIPRLDALDVPHLCYGRTALPVPARRTGTADTAAGTKVRAASARRAETNKGVTFSAGFGVTPGSVRAGTTGDAVSSAGVGVVPGSVRAGTTDDAVSFAGVGAMPGSVRTDTSADMRAIPEIAGMLRRLRPQILHTHASLAGRIAGLLAGVPVRLMTRHCAFPPSPWLCRFPGKQGNGAFQCLLTHRFIAVARAAKQNLTETGIPADRVTVIVNGSDPLRKVPTEELQAMRERLGIPADSFVVGICARLEACKDHDTFLRAAKLCLLRDPSLRFLVVGKGKREAELRRLAGTLGIGNSVIFTGFAPDPAPYFRLFSVNVNCSVGTETSCLAISEGYSAGIPAIVSDFGGNPDMVENGKTGFVVPMRDSAAFAEKILLLRDHPELLRSMSENARARYRQKYTASGMTRALEAVYEELLRGSQVRIRTRRLVTKK